MNNDGGIEPGSPLPCPPRANRQDPLAPVLAALAEAADRDGGPGALRRAFEAAVQAALPVRQVRLRDARRGLGAASPAADRCPESVRLEVPGCDPARRAWLEARFDPGCPMDAGAMQVLGAAAHLAALVLAFERRGTGGLGRGARARVDGAAPLIGSSAAMRVLRDRIGRIARTDFTVLIEGESGTGKELVARQIHDLSARAHGPFVAINCAALVETLLEAELFGIEDGTATGVRGRRGKFEHADGGTLFLDEVSDLSMSAQAKLLRAIQELAVERVGGVGSRRVDVRILVATNRRLAELVNRGLLRHDLFYRLSGVDLHVPPLRTRREDILELAVYFLARYRGVRPFELSQAAADGLLVYDWPGNVRELERLIEGVVALAQTDRIELDDLPPLLRGGYADVLLPSLVARETMRAWGSRYARLVLERCGQNKRRACRLLDISYHTLQAYLRFPCDEGATAEPPPPPAWPRRSPQEVEAPAICRVAEAPPGEVLCGTPCEFGRVDVEG